LFFSSNHTAEVAWHANGAFFRHSCNKFDSHLQEASSMSLQWKAPMKGMQLADPRQACLASE
jgi:hypothetical protein